MMTFFEQAVCDIAQTLSEIRQRQHLASDQKSWEMAGTYVRIYRTLVDTYRRDYGVEPSTHMINRAIADAGGYSGPTATWLSDALETRRVFPDIFHAGVKNLLPYDWYRAIATCSLQSDDTKHELREWAEKTHPKRAKLRERIRELIAKETGGPDFDVQTTNCWPFSAGTRWDDSNGTHPELIANLLYHYTAPEDTVIDPFAREDITYQVTQHYEFFKAANPATPQSGPRQVQRADAMPQYHGVKRADVRLALPWRDNFAQLCVIDLSGLDDDHIVFAPTTDGWQTGVRQAVENISRVLKPNGILSIIVNDRWQNDQFQPLVSIAFAICTASGLEPANTIYSPDPIHRKATRHTQLVHLSEMRVIHVFRKPGNA